MPSVPQEHFAEINSADVQMYTCKNTTAGTMHDISLIIAIASSECSRSATQSLTFLFFHTLYQRVEMALARLHVCTGSSEHSLLR